MFRRRLASLPIAALLVLTGQLAQAQDGGGKVWIDQPLGAVVITWTPVTVTAHATHPAGVTEVRLAVDGGTVAAVAAGGEMLETVEMSWAPPGSGVYLIEVSGFGGGEWGSPGSVVVTVDLGETEVTTTTAPSTTTTPRATTTTSATTTTTTPRTTTSTTTTTTTPRTTTTSTTTSTTTTTTTPRTTTTTSTTTCNLGTPSPAGVSGTGTFSPTVSWSYSACREPEEFEIQVSRTTDFLRLEWEGLAAGDQRSTTVGVGADCTTYYWRIRTYDLGSYGPWSGVSSFFVQTGRSCP